MHRVTFDYAATFPLFSTKTSTHGISFVQMTYINLSFKIINCVLRSRERCSSTKYFPVRRWKVEKQIVTTYHFLSLLVSSVSSVIFISKIWYTRIIKFNLTTFFHTFFFKRNKTSKTDLGRRKFKKLDTFS